jgi:hypothetical protein
MQFIFDILVEFILEVLLNGILRFIAGVVRVIKKVFKVFKRKQRL